MSELYPLLLVEIRFAYNVLYYTFRVQFGSFAPTMRTNLSLIISTLVCLFVYIAIPHSYSFVRLFDCSFVRSIVCSFDRLFDGSFDRRMNCLINTK